MTQADAHTFNQPMEICLEKDNTGSLRLYSTFANPKIYPAIFTSFILAICFLANLKLGLKHC